MYYTARLLQLAFAFSVTHVARYILRAACCRLHAALGILHVLDLEVTVRCLYLDFLQLAFLTECVASYVLHLTSPRVKLHLAYRTLLLHAAG